MIYYYEDDDVSQEEHYYRLELIAQLIEGGYDD